MSNAAAKGTATQLPTTPGTIIAVQQGDGSEEWFVRLRESDRRRGDGPWLSLYDRQTWVLEHNLLWRVLEVSE